MTDVAEMSHSLERGEQGIWTPARRDERPLSFPIDGHAECYQIEEGSFWFRHRNACLLELLRRFPPSGTVFELGAGNGFVAAAFEKAGYSVAALEPAPEGARNAKLRGVGTVICSTLESAGFRDESLPAVGLFDVIEHIEQDGPLLREVTRVLEPGGRVYVSVPAYRWLWSDEDRMAGHFRRYSLRRIRKDLGSAGLSIEHASHIFTSLVGPVFLLRTLPSLGGRFVHASNARAAAQHTPPEGLVTRALVKALDLELAWLRGGRSLPFGASCVVVARKPG
jgi:SAM-dependent methyltransferase